LPKIKKAPTWQLDLAIVENKEDKLQDAVEVF